MKILRILTRIYVNDLDAVLPFYEGLLGEKVSRRFRYPGPNLELANIGTVLFVAGSDEHLKPFRSTAATWTVDHLDEFEAYLRQNGATILRGPQPVPTGRNMTAQHADGTIIEYVELAAQKDD